MKKKMIYALSAVMLLTLSGCGLKGPLYFPPEEPAASKPAPAENAKPVTQSQQPSDTTTSSHSGK